MSDSAETPIAPEKVDPDSVELRVKPRPVTRINRRVVIGGVALGVTAIAGLVILALRPVVWTAQGPTELLNTDTKPYAEGLEGLPKRYDAVRPPERIGEIAPAAGDRDQPSPDAAAQLALLDQDLQDQLRLARQARSAPVFFQIKGQAILGRESSPSTAQADPGRDALTALQGDLQSLAPGTPLAAGSSSDTAQTDKLSFLNAKPEAGIYNAHSLQKPASPYQLMAGTVIAASLITGLNSDLPGFVIAQVTEPVYDTVSGKHLLIPQGARLVGKYDARVSFGQNRALIVWQRIIRPDGSSIVIENLPATDQGGYAGLSDEVDNHTWQLVKGIALATLLNVGTELSFGGDENDLVEALRQGLGQTTNRAASQIVERQLNVQPTIKVRPGWPLRVIVQKDLVLSPYPQK
ncbi:MULTISPECIES: TrbI/VirB10 family protein [Rhodomicrobium]|uniref:TrbI/VirB10 family protein n=1 Tax=Rhodomicrobium TaxID=1068 RepID=UPI000B4B6054|nr:MULTISPECIES: TrbI/VirB10 family protein [Rhodomicrobium]